jgi:hypothetical protein
LSDERRVQPKAGLSGDEPDCGGAPRGAGNKHVFIELRRVIAKTVFQVHRVGKNGSVVVQWRLRRSQVLGFFLKIAVRRRD